MNGQGANNPFTGYDYRLSMIGIHINSVTDQGVVLDEREEAGVFPLLEAVSGEGAVSFIRPVHVRLQATSVGETVLIEGKADSTVRIPCSRCLEPFDMIIETAFSATAVPDSTDMPDSDAADDIELAADDMDVIAYSGERIDLRDEIAQQIIMALPCKPLCGDTCKGLCNRCGVDLNKTACQCQSQDENNPFSVLKHLSFPKKEE